MAPPAPEAQLPPGWVAAIDPSSGRTYYANTVTVSAQFSPSTYNRWRKTSSSRRCSRSSISKSGGGDGGSVS